MLSKVDAAYQILKRKGKPMDVNDIIEIAIKKEMIKTKGKTPADTLRVDIYKENKRKKGKKESRRFTELGNGMVGLSEWV